MLFIVSLRFVGGADSLGLWTKSFDEVKVIFVYNILKISTFAAEKESFKCHLSNVPAETLFCKNYSGALLSHDIFYDMGMFSTYPSLQSSAYLHVLCSQIMVMPLRN